MIPMRGPADSLIKDDHFAGVTVAWPTHPVGDASGHGRNQDDTSCISETQHLLTCCLCSIQNSAGVDV